MSDIRFNQWLHNSGTGGVSQVDGGHVGIGTTNPLIPVGSGNTSILNVGVVTANSYYGDGSNLSNITSTTINNNANNRVITGSGTANTLEAEANLTFNGNALEVNNTSSNTAAHFKGAAGAGFIQITDSDDSSTAFIGVDGGALKFQTSGSSYSDKLRIASDGKIGVSRVATQHPFEIGHASSPTQSFWRGSTKGFAISAESAATYLMSYENVPLIFSVASGSSYTERLRITSTGAINCGHGSAVNLHGSSTTGINLNANNNSGQIIANASSNRALIIGRQSDYGQVIEFFQGSNTNEAGITIPAADTLGLETNGTERFRLKGDGVIEMGTSIGATSDSNIRLRLGRAGDCYLGIRVTSNDTSETGIKFGDASSEHDGKLAYLHTGRRFRFTVGGNDRIFIEMNGDLKGQLSNANIIGFMGAKTTAGTTNWNDSTNARSGSGHTLLLGTHSNGPGPSLYYHPFTFEYAQRDSNGNMTQLAIPYNGGAIYSRYRYSGSWSGWTSH